MSNIFKGIQLIEQQLDELSPETLSSYKKKAGSEAGALDKAAWGGAPDAQDKINKANKRFSGIVRATKKELDNDVKNIKENAEELNIGDPVIISGDVQFNGATGDIVGFSNDKHYVIVDLYNHGKRSFHSSDVSFNDYADSDDEEARMYDAGELRDVDEGKMKGVDVDRQDHDEMSPQQFYGQHGRTKTDWEGQFSSLMNPKKQKKKASAPKSSRELDYCPTCQRGDNRCVCEGVAEGKGINWSGSNKEREHAISDWSGKINGKYVDLVRSIDGTWSYFYDNKRVEGGLSSRNEAMQRLNGFLQKQGVAEGSKEKTPGIALSKAYKKDFDGNKPGHNKPETALTGAYSKTGKPGGELKKQGVAESTTKYKVHCSQCGNEFTRDKNEGYSHCKDHSPKKKQDVAESSKEKSDTYRAGYQNARRTTLSGKPIESKLSGHPDYKAGYKQGVADHKAWENEHNNKEQDVAEAGYGSNRGYTHGFASPTAPKLGSTGRRDDERNSEFDDKMRAITGMIFYNNVDDPEEAMAIGLKQTSKGKWYLRTGNRLAQKVADNRFGPGKVWYPTNEDASAEVDEGVLGFMTQPAKQAVPKRKLPSLSDMRKEFEKDKLSKTPDGSRSKSPVDGQQFTRQVTYEQDVAPSASKPVNMKRWLRDFERREDNNFHTENVLAMAQLVGTPEDVATMKQLVKQHRGFGLSEKQFEIRQAITDRLRPLVKQKIAASQTQGVAEAELDEECWKGYTQYGMKDKNGKKVPNCVPVKETKSNILKGLM